MMSFGSFATATRGFDLHVERQLIGDDMLYSRLKVEIYTDCVRLCVCAELMQCRYKCWLRYPTQGTKQTPQAWMGVRRGEKT